MVDSSLLEYVRSELARGAGPDAIKSALLAQGWQANIVEEAFRDATGSEGAVIVPLVGTASENRRASPGKLVRALKVLLLLPPRSRPRLRKFLIALNVFMGVVLVAFVSASLIAKDVPPIDDSDLQLRKVDLRDSENAYFDLQKLKGVVYEPKDKSKQIASVISGETWDDEFVFDITSRNQTALKIFSDAARKYGYQVPEFADPQTIDAFAELKGLGDTQRIARIGTLQALKLARDGRGQDAMNQAFDVARIGQKMEASQSSIIVYLVALAVKSMGLNAARQVTLSASLSDDVLQQYQQELISLDGNENGLLSALKFEYFTNVSLLEIAAGGKFRTLGWNRFYYKPNKTKLLFADHIRRYIKNVHELCYEMRPVTDEYLIPSPIVMIVFTPNAIGRIIYDSIAVGFSNIVEEKQCKEPILYGVTQATFAIGAFFQDNNQLPTSLNELVPDYLPSIPLDPYDGKPLKYSAQKQIIYSVGKDGKDSGGTDGDDIVF